MRVPRYGRVTGKLGLNNRVFFRFRAYGAQKQNVEKEHNKEQLLRQQAAQQHELQKLQKRRNKTVSLRPLPELRHGTPFRIHA